MTKEAGLSKVVGMEKDILLVLYSYGPFIDNEQKLKIAKQIFALLSASQPEPQTPVSWERMREHANRL